MAGCDCNDVCKTTTYPLPEADHTGAKGRVKATLWRKLCRSREAGPAVRSAHPRSAAGTSATISSHAPGLKAGAASLDRMTSVRRCDRLRATDDGAEKIEPRQPGDPRVREVGLPGA